jgi:hypothetical protein
MLLAARLDRLSVEGKDIGTLVAFSAEGLGREQEFQALIGGAV